MPRTIRDSIIHQIAIRELRVVRVADITSGMRRVTFAGEQLGEFTHNGSELPPFRSDGFDDDVKLVFPYPGEHEPVLPTLKDGRLQFPKGRRPLLKSYTVRRWDRDRGELEIDFVRHGTGVATTWANRCGPGARLHVGGPVRSVLLPAGVEWLLVAGDETALPAIGRLLEELPSHLKAQVFVEIAEPAHEQELKTDADVTITWLHRDGAEPGATTLLDDAVRGAQWWPGEMYAWIAGETLSIKPLRRFLTEERGIPKENVEVTGYWRRTEVETLADDPEVPEPEEETAFDRLHEMAEMAPPFALRAAVTLGIPELISRGTTETSALAEGAGADPVAVGKLLRYLEALDVVTHSSPDNYALTEMGDLLTEEFVVDVLDLDGPIARQELGFIGLIDAVRRGGPSYRDVFGKDFADLRADADFESTLLEVTAKTTRYIAPALAADPALATPGHIVVHSDGSAVIAAEIAAATPGSRITVVAMPSQVEYLQSDLDASITDEADRARIVMAEQSIFEPSPSADAVLLVRVLDRYPEPDAVRVLAQAASGAGTDGRVIVLEHPLDDEALDEHDGEEDLKNLVLYGTGHRTDAENRALFDAARLRVLETRTVGWGYTLYVLRAEDQDPR